MNRTVPPLNESPSDAARRTSQRRRSRLGLKAAPEPPKKFDDSESSIELDFEGAANEGGIQKQFGRLELSSAQNSSRSMGLTETSVSNNSSINEESFQHLLHYNKARRSSATKESKAPPKASTTQIFKLDGAPGFMIPPEEARPNAEQRRRRSRKTMKAMAEFQESLSSLQPKKQRPKVHFLNLPKDHPLYWDAAILPGADFPEEDRAFLAKILKKPEATNIGSHIRQQKLPRRVELILKKLHLVDWDVSTIGRSAMVLFHPDSNPLNLKSEVTNYFFTRLNSLKTNIEEDGGEVVYREKTYSSSSQHSMVELAGRLRQDFKEATTNYEAYQSTPY